MTTISIKFRRGIRAALLEGGVFGHRARYFVMLFFIFAVLVGGGASRHDVLSLVYVRPIAILVIGYALIARQRNEVENLPIPFWLLLGLGGIMVLQLIPLPYEWWTALPGRDAVAIVGQTASLPEVARPLSLAPSRTLNSLFALSVPVAAFLLYSIQTSKAKKTVPTILLLAAVASTVLALLQGITGSDSSFYTYRIHTPNQLVGLLANRNHQSLLLSAGMLLAALALLRVQPDDRLAPAKSIALLGYIVFLVPFILVLGSRAGLVLMTIAFALAVFIAFEAPPVAQLLQRGRRHGSPIVRRFANKGLLLSALAFTGAGIAGYAVWNNRALSIDRISDSGNEVPLSRSEIFETLIRMVGDFFPWGSGFGSFDSVFRQYESTAALSTFYLNQAHNDWLQLVIEGGLPAAVLLGALVVWMLAGGIRTMRMPNSPAKFRLLGLYAIVLLAGMASAPDYPIRVPIISMLIAFVLSGVSFELRHAAERHKE